MSHEISEDDLKELKENQKEMLNQLDTIRVVLVGDKLVQPPVSGLVDKVGEHDRTLYGDTARGVVGHETMVKTLWTDRVKLFAIAGAVSLVCGVLGWAIQLWMGHK